MKRRPTLRPLTLAQFLSSAAGALPILVGSARMVPSEFAAFSVVTLASTLTVGAARAAIFQPALIQQRVDGDASVPRRYAGTAALAALLVIAAISHFTVGFGLAESLLVGAFLMLPVAYDWARYRAIGKSRRWAVARGDALRLAVALLALLPVVPPTVTAFCLTVGASCALGIPVVLWRVPLRDPYYPYSSYRRSALWQSVDFLVGQFIVSAPLFVLAGAGAGQLIAGVRLAQTLLGPLNLAFSAATTNLVADGSTSAAFRRSSSVIRQGWRASAKLATMAAGVVAVMASATLLVPLTLSGVSRDDLTLGILLVGGATVFTGWSGIHGIVLRVLGHQAAVTWSRLGLALITTAGFVGGFLVGGERLSLVLGFAMNALAAPTVFLPVAMHYYGRDRAAEADSA